MGGDTPMAALRTDVVPCSRVRSTVIVSSIHALRAAGHYDAYAARVDPGVRERLVTLGAPTWLPVDLARAHYTACDALRLPGDEVRRISGALAPVHASGVDVLIRAARVGGLSPWAIFTRAPRYWERMYEGGALVVHEDGPKDARLVVLGQPLAEVGYWRTGFAGILCALADALSTRAYVKETPGPQSVSYGISWA